MNIESVVLLSGGMDSATLLWRERSKRRSTLALGVHYGQRHATELEAAAVLAREAGVEFSLVDLSSIRPLLAGSSQTDSNVDVPDGHYTDDIMKKTIVPNRNMILLSIAVAAAAGLGARRVLYAAHAGDHAIYPDCRPEFVEAMAVTVQRATLWHPVQLETPFVYLTKAQICAEGNRLGVPFELTYSCYKGDSGAHCGKCGTCVERREAFELAGVRDPTTYSSS